MKQILLDFWNFIKDPRDERYLGNDKKYKWKVLLTLFVFKLLFLIVYLPIYAVVEKFITIEEAFDESFDMFTSFFLFVLFVPFLEELVFRYFLRRRGIMTFLFSEKTWHRAFPILFYSSVLTFGFIHITNYELTNVWILIAAPILVFTQIIGGSVMSYLRVKFNFWMGFLYHALWNFVAFFIIDGSYYLLNIDKVDVKNDTYELVIEPQQFLSWSESAEMYYTQETDTIYEISANYYTSQEIIDVLEPDNSDYKGNSKLLKFDFNSEKGIPTDSLFKILEKEGFIEKQTPTN